MDAIIESLTVTAGCRIAVTVLRDFDAIRVDSVNGNRDTAGHRPASVRRRVWKNRRLTPVAVSPTELLRARLLVTKPMPAGSTKLRCAPHLERYRLGWPVPAERSG
jgi:hypothetical protein